MSSFACNHGAVRGLLLRRCRRAMSSNSMNVFDRELKIKHKARSVVGEDAREFDYLRDIAADRIADRLLDVTRTFPVALDIGCHSGHVLKALRDTGNTKVGHLIMSDACEEILMRDLPESGVVDLSPAIPTVERVVADEELLQVPTEERVDLVTSCLSLHWVNDLPGTLVQIRERLNPDGVFVGAILGGETLHELRTSLLIAEQERDGGVSAHVSPLAQVSDVGNLLTRTGFNMPTVDSEKIEVRFDNAFEMMRHIKGMGESNAVLSRRAWTGADVFLATAAVYQEMFGDPDDGTVPATFEIIYAIGWRPDESQTKPKKRGSQDASLKDLQSMVKRVDPSAPPAPSDTSASSASSASSDAADGEVVDDPQGGGEAGDDNQGPDVVGDQGGIDADGRFTFPVLRGDDPVLGEGGGDGKASAGSAVDADPDEPPAVNRKRRVQAPARKD